MLVHILNPDTGDILVWNKPKHKLDYHNFIEFAISKHSSSLSMRVTGSLGDEIDLPPSVLCFFAEWGYSLNIEYYDSIYGRLESLFLGF